MLNRIRYIFSGIFILSIALSTAGCTVVFQKGRRVDVEKISKLKNELSDVERAKAELENRLQQELNDREVEIEMLQGRIVITFVADVLFASGKADLRTGSQAKLRKVAGVLQTTVKDLNIGVEGHTDNVPIKHSGWDSNWELSTARALSVLHYLVDKEGVDPRRVAATGYGEYKPRAGNSTKEGRAKNRRVEIVILPDIEKKSGQ